jgi:hypothetical protein
MSVIKIKLFDKVLKFINLINLSKHIYKYWFVDYLFLKEIQYTLTKKLSYRKT